MPEDPKQVFKDLEACAKALAGLLFSCRCLQRRNHVGRVLEPRTAVPADGE